VNATQTESIGSPTCADDLENFDDLSSATVIRVGLDVVWSSGGVGRKSWKLYCLLINLLIIILP
jgi:hypothetical protein